MRLTAPRTGRLVVAGLAAAGVACVTIALAQQDHAPMAPPVAASTPTPVPSRGTTSPTPAEMPSSPPVTLSIPAISVRSQLLQLGQDANGALEVPAPGPHYDQAGWYRYSPTPGAMGPAVIAGHVDSARGGPSVFYRLGELHPGDQVFVQRADGSVAVFAVDAVRRFPKAAFPTALVYGNTDHPALRLITCGGPFDRASGHYLDNVVVTASLIRGA
jgi:hypothetical protein